MSPRANVVSDFQNLLVLFFTFLTFSSSFRSLSGSEQLLSPSDSASQASTKSGVVNLGPVFTAFPDAKELAVSCSEFFVFQAEFLTSFSLKTWLNSLSKPKRPPIWGWMSRPWLLF